MFDFKDTTQETMIKEAKVENYVSCQEKRNVPFHSERTMVLSFCER